MNQDVREEIWKDIDGFEGLYAISDRGRVMNLKSRKVLKNRIGTVGYVRVSLYRGDGKEKTYTVHRLVAEAFIPNPDNLPQVNHKDENKTNNDVRNLSWVTASQNNKHSLYQRSCKINQLTLDGGFIKTWESGMQIEKELGYNSSSINNCCKGKRKRKQAYGYKWQYAEPKQQRKLNRPVAALTKDGDLIAEYKSVAEASRCLKISDTQIRYCLNGTYKSTHGLSFIYID